MHKILIVSLIVLGICLHLSNADEDINSLITEIKYIKEVIDGNMDKQSICTLYAYYLAKYYQTKIEYENPDNSAWRKLVRMAVIQLKQNSMQGDYIASLESCLNIERFSAFINPLARHWFNSDTCVEVSSKFDSFVDNLSDDLSTCRAQLAACTTESADWKSQSLQFMTIVDELKQKVKEAHKGTPSQKNVASQLENWLHDTRNDVWDIREKSYLAQRQVRADIDRVVSEINRQADKLDHLKRSIPNKPKASPPMGHSDHHQPSWHYSHASSSTASDFWK